MRSAIATIMAILGTVLVLSGAAAFWAMALNRPAAPEVDPITGPTSAPKPASRMDRTVGTLAKVPTPDRLILWGVLLLALSAVAAGAISISATATAGNR
jgi:hypothetical protein